VFGNVIGIAVLDAGGLPTQEMACWIRAETINPVKVNAPLVASLHPLAAHGGKRNSRGRIPDFGFLVDARFGCPAGIPVVVIVEFAVALNIRPVIPECSET
jgi:hypothetical protein